jgi:hypothetical protein
MARSGKRSISICRYPTTEPAKFIDIKVAYNEGGHSYFSGQSSPRAYYLHVTPIEVEDFEGHEIVKTLMFHGRKALLEEVKRYSEKKLGELAEQTRQECARRDPHIMRIVNVVLAEENLTLANVEPARV